MPQDLFDRLNSEFAFTIDAAATEQNAKCARFYTEEQGGLSKDWSGERVFVNPPYNRYSMRKWLAKCASPEAELCVALLPVRTNASWFHDYIWGKAEIRYIRGKLKFNGCAKQAPFPSMICIWRKNCANPAA